MAARLPRFQKGQALSHRDLNAISEAISEQESGEFQRARKRRPADFLCKIVPFGPGGEPTFPDSRYWVRQVRLQTGLPPDNAIPIGMQEIAFGTSTPVWAEAINLSEVIDGSHSIVVGAIVRIFEIRDWAGQTHFVFTSVAASSLVEDVKIAYVVSCPLGDCGAYGAEEQSNWNLIAGLTGASGDHLACFRVDINGTPLTAEPYLAVLPNTGHSVDEFLPVAWNINSNTQTSFLAFRNDGVWRMGSFGEGEQWTTPPTNLCGSPTGESGACCESDGTCIDNATQTDCESGGGSYVGDGTSCGLLAGGCAGDPIGACCCPQGSACYNPAVGGPVTCSANVIETQCTADGGMWQGAFTTCAGSPCGEPISGACCMANNECQQQPDDIACGLAGGVFFVGEICPSGAELWGACCFGQNCLMSNRLCCESQSGVWVGGLCSADPCGGGAQQPTGQQAGRSA